MATGFTNRWKGKVTASSLWLGGRQMSGYGAVDNFTSTQTAIVYGSPYKGSVSMITSTSVVSVLTLPRPIPGVGHSIVVLTESTVQIRASTAGPDYFSLYGGTTSIVMKSTGKITVELLGLSSVAWGVMGYYSSLATTLPAFSTTT